MNKAKEDSVIFECLRKHGFASSFIVLYEGETYRVITLRSEHGNTGCGGILGIIDFSKRMLFVVDYYLGLDRIVDLYNSTLLLEEDQSWELRVLRTTESLVKLRTFFGLSLGDLRELDLLRGTCIRIQATKSELSGLENYFDEPARIQSMNAEAGDQVFHLDTVGRSCMLKKGPLTKEQLFPVRSISQGLSLRDV